MHRRAGAGQVIDDANDRTLLATSVPLAACQTEVRGVAPLRYSRKISDGGGLYLLVTPKGGRCWRYSYRFAHKHKTLALVYPDVPLERARSRHEFARNLLARGVDPSALKAALGKHIFVVTMREWGIAQGRTSTPFKGYTPPNA